MRARFAYITSLGTTAILVGAALFMLGVVGAIVAFHGWPGGADGRGVHSLPLAPDGATKRVALARHTKAGGVVRTSARTATAAAKRLTTAGLVKQGGTGPALVGGVVMTPVATTTPHPTSPAPNPGTRPTTVAPEPARGFSPGDGGSYTEVPLPGLAQVPLPGTVAAPDVVSGIGELIPALPPPPALAVKMSGR